MPMLTSLPENGGALSNIQRVLSRELFNPLPSMYGTDGDLPEGEKFLGGGVNWKQYFPREWLQYLTPGEDPKHSNAAYYRNDTLHSLHRALNPDQWGGSFVSDTYNQNNNPWEQTWNRWVVKGGQDPEELAQLINRASGGKINVDGATLSKLAEARRSTYTGDLPDTVAGLEGFYNKSSVLAERNRIFQNQLDTKKHNDIYLNYIKSKNQPTSMMTPAASNAPFMGKAPTVGDTSNWKAQSMFS
jgi:hypothetical protein